jgi:hypothetical protein
MDTWNSRIWRRGPRRNTMGTLKSTRMRTRLPLTSTSVIDFLLNMLLGSVDILQNFSLDAGDHVRSNHPGASQPLNHGRGQTPGQRPWQFCFPSDQRP